MITADTLAHQVARATLQTGGATVATDGSSPTDGYAVALPGRELIIPLETDGTCAAYYGQECYSCDPEAFIAGQVVTYLQDRASDLEVAGNYLGTWTDAGQLYLDISTVVDTLAGALELGRRHAQLAVFDLSAGAEIRLDTVAQVAS